MPTAKLVARAAADNLTPCSFELGGKSPNIVLDDAELTVAAIPVPRDEARAFGVIEVDADGRIVFSVSHLFSSGVMDIVNERRTLWYYSRRDIPPALEALGTRAVAAFELARRYNPHIVGIDAEIERLKAESGGAVSADPLGCDQRTASR